MKEIRMGSKAVRKINNMCFYGQYYDNKFQVLESKKYSEKIFNNLVKKYL